MKLKNLIFICLLFLSISIPAQADLNVVFDTEVKNKIIKIYANNQEYMPVSAQFTFKMVNMQSDVENKKIIVIPARTSRFLVATISTIIPNKRTEFSYQNLYNFGNASQTSFEADYIYDLPYAKGKMHSIFQGYNGKLSHQKQKALDFDFPVGEKIYAAREGTVVATEDRNSKNCAYKGCDDYNNKIMIIHPDGTFGEYLHLKQNGVAVKTGEKIAKGQFLGYSGNTGWSTGPHLHFAVFLNRLAGERLFIETKFKTSRAASELLKENGTYTKNY